MAIMTDDNAEKLSDLLMSIDMAMEERSALGRAVSTDDPFEIEGWNEEKLDLLTDHIMDLLGESMIQSNILGDIEQNQREGLEADEEQREDQTRRDKFDNGPDPVVKPPAPVDTDDGSFEMPTASGVTKFLGAAAIAPFAFKFIKGFLSEITDGLINITGEGVLEALRLPALVKLFDDMTDILKPIFNPIRNVLQSASKLKAGPLGKTLSFFLGPVGAVGKLFGKLVWPFSIFMAAIDGVQAFKESEEGTFLQRFGDGVGAAFGDLIGAPLDLLTSAVGWLVGKMGFDETSEAIQSFSFEEQIAKMTGGLFGVLWAHMPPSQTWLGLL